MVSSEATASSAEPSLLWLHPRRQGDMLPCGSCRTFCSILLLLGGNLALIVEIPHVSVECIVGQSVLLPVSYKFNNSSPFLLSIKWTFNNNLEHLITCTVCNCSLSADGAPQNCSTNCFPSAMYRGRVVLFPENASLLLQDVQLNDSGVYSVTFKQQILTKNITLTVYRLQFTSEDDNTYVLLIMTCTAGGCVILFLLLFLLYCLWHFGTVLLERPRVIRQQESSSHDELHMENQLRSDVCTVYELLGDNQTQASVMPEAEHMSVNVRNIV